MSMKNRLLALIASSALTLPMFSAMNMYVKQKDGSIVTFSVDNVAEVYYGEANSQIVETPAVEASSSDLKYFILNDNECEVTGFINGSANIVVPERVSINGKPYVVTSIGEEAFLEQKRIKTVTLPNTIKTIGDDAFEGCENLTSVNLPEGLENIGIGAFLECGLKSVDIPSSVTYIGYGAFEDCNSIQQPRVLIYDNGTKCYGWIGDREQCTSVVIPDGVTVIEEEAFEYCENLSSVVIPSSVTTIEREAFYSCKSLKELTIPSSVTAIWKYAFSHCENLDVIIDNLQENVKFYDFDDDERTVESTMQNSEAFYGCKSVTFKEDPNFGAGTNFQNMSAIQVVAGEKYTATNQNVSFDFTVLSVEGSYLTKNQVVRFEIDGIEYVLSDAGTSYLMWNGNGGFECVNKVVADANAKDIVMILACANSSADYTITSATANTTLFNAGAIETLFSTSSQIEQGTDDENDKVDESSEARIQVQQGGKYYASNPLINFYFEVVDVEGTLEDKNQMVKLIIDGYEYQLSDIGTSYLIWENGSFFTVNKADADANAERVVMVLSSANSTANYTLASGTTNSTLIRNGVHKTVFSVDNREKEIEEIVAEQALTEIQVVTAGKYAASNEVKSLSFKVNSVEGSYTSKNQVVVIEIDGEEFKLSDAGDSYLMWTGSYFVTANTATAKANAKNLVLMLACANSSADYTITSASVNDTMRQLGATKTLFAKK